MFNAPKSVIPHHFLFQNVVKASYEFSHCWPGSHGTGKAWNEPCGTVDSVEEEHQPAVKCGPRGLQGTREG